MSAALIKEDFGQFSAELQIINTADGAPLALTRLRPIRISQAHPLIFIHGSYSNRHFWLSPKGVGLAGYLVERGYEVWLMEWRGHGRSTKTENYRRWTAEDMMRFDYAAASDWVFKQTQRQAIWIGHSFGGLLLLGALGRGWLPHSQVAAAAVFGSQITYGEEYLRFPPLAWAARQALGLMGRFPSRLLKLGPEDEPPGVIQEVVKWKHEGEWRSSDGVDYKQQLRQIVLPFKAFAGAADTTDPATGCEELFQRIGSTRKEYCLLGTATGLRRNYGHVDMIVSKEAAQEVWPRLADWLMRVQMLSR